MPELLKDKIYFSTALLSYYGLINNGICGGDNVKTTNKTSNAIVKKDSKPLCLSFLHDNAVLYATQNEIKTLI